MTRDEARDALLSGKDLVYQGTWVWSATYFTCIEGCCDESFSLVEETLDCVEEFAGKDYEGVTIIG